MKKYVLICLFMTLILSGCSKQNVSQDSTKSTIDETVTETDDYVNGNLEEYTEYAGTWTENGVTRQYILTNGGIELYLEIKNENQILANISSQQGLTERFAEIRDIECRISDGKAQYEFNDDGWGNKGTLCLKFSEDSILVWVEDFHMSEDNVIGFGISGEYQLQREGTGEVEMPEEIWDSIEESNTIAEVDLQDLIYERYYEKWSNEEMMEAIKERNPYLLESSYYEVITRYRENIQGITDVLNVVEPLFYTDMMYYTKEDFTVCNLEVLNIAKNEIFARHGWIFENEDVKNYFMGQIWYEPSVKAEEFDDSVLNQYEVYNLDVIMTCIKTKNKDA